MHPVPTLLFPCRQGNRVVAQAQSHLRKQRVDTEAHIRLGNRGEFIAGERVE